MRHLHRRPYTRITRRQFVFLRAMRDESITLKQAIERFKVKDWVMSNWLRHPVFRLAAAEAMREKRRRQKLAFAAAVVQATDVMTDIMNGVYAGNHLLRECARNVLEVDALLRRGGRRKKPAEKIVVPPPQATPILNPNLSPEEQREMFNQLQGKRVDERADDSDDAPSTPAGSETSAT